MIHLINMGGIINKDKLVSENGKPATFFRMSGNIGDQSLNWICGGNIPPFHDCLNYLATNGNVGMIMSLTIEPIKSGRNIDHIPYDFVRTKWVNGDDNLDKTLTQFHILHVPIADTGFPTEENAKIILDGVKKYHETHPDKSVYFHCWAGQ